MLTNCCPAATTLPTIPSVGCAMRFGQIQKIIFQRVYKTAGTLNSITGVTTGSATTGDATLLASWTALKAKTDGEKISVTPYVEEPTSDGGDARTVGGGNASLNGIETVIGSNPVSFSCKLNNVPQAIVAELKKLMCECIANNLGVYLINENGQIQGQVIATATGSKTWAPIPIQKLFISDMKHGGLEGNDSNDVQFSFAPGYSDKLDVLTLDASALSL